MHKINRRRYFNDFPIEFSLTSKNATWRHHNIHLRLRQCVTQALYGPPSNDFSTANNILDILLVYMLCFSELWVESCDTIITHKIINNILSKNIPCHSKLKIKLPNISTQMTTSHHTHLPLVFYETVAVERAWIYLMFWH